MTKIKHMGLYTGERIKTKTTSKRGKVTTKVTPDDHQRAHRGVSQHKLNTISLPFFAFVHVGLGLRDDNPPPDPTPTPTPTPTATPTADPTSTPTPTATPPPTPTPTESPTDSLAPTAP